MHVAWPEIESFHHVRKAAAKYPELLRGRTTVQYRAKVKLHGTNAGVCFRAGRATAQSRSAVIAPGSDNMGFAAWVESVQDELAAAYRRMPSDAVVFGEWCGPGVQKGVAVSQIPKRCFAVFAAVLIDKHGEASDHLVTDPRTLAEWTAGVSDTHVLPWYGNAVDVPWFDGAELLGPVIDGINSEVGRVEAEDPWVAETFGVKGTGEGLVFYPVSHPGKENFSNLAFKAKGEKHRVVAHTKPAQADPAQAESAEKFAEMVLPGSRLEQGARHVAGGELVFENRLIGPFLAWVTGDVKKECQDELAASGLDWKQVQKPVSERARKWYIENSNKIY